ncbi:MAG: tRNA (N6-threonylcarbamoyladenosine(37)-N6)-methyltransferase TrmO [Chloroflexota bacterium]
MGIGLEPIGIIHSCYREKFGIPRQAGLVPDAVASLELYPPYNTPEAVKGLETFSHLWVIFIFHASQRDGWKATVRPPRLGGNQRLGVFATRSMFRPNPIGLSAVLLESVEVSSGKALLHIKGGDLLEGTPVLDIKPYLPYADTIPQAIGGFATSAPTSSFTGTFTSEARSQCQALESDGYPNLQAIIEQTLQLDPRPAYYSERPQKTEFGMRLYDFDVKWRVQHQEILVVDIESA